jgi:biopolymer transport protein ExbD
MLYAFEKLFREGGWVIYPIFAASILVWYIGIGKAVRIGHYTKKWNRLMKAFQNNEPISSLKGMNPAFLSLYQKLHSSTKMSRRQRACSEFMSVILPKVEEGVSTIATLAVVAPLLGLAGTISGMNEMFSVIGMFGFGNPTIMAHGISIALLAPLTGLGVAVVALFIYDYMQRAKTKFFENLDIDLERLSEGEKSEAGKKGADMPYAQYRLMSDAMEKPEINLAPFVDTIMILLIFFVVTANLYVETGVDVTKPKASSAKPMSQKSILIGVTREGTVHVYGRQVSLERLKLIVEQETSKQPDISVVIIADRSAEVGRAVEVMDNCMIAGAQKISIAAGKEGQN